MDIKDRLKKIMLKEQSEGSTAQQAEAAPVSLLELIKDNYLGVYQTPNGEAYISAGLQGYRVENLPISSSAFRLYASKLYYKEHGRMPKKSEIAETLDLLIGQALFESPVFENHVRLASENGAIYLDLCDEKYRQVKIDKNKWEVIESIHSPVNFIRMPRMQPMVLPEKGGTLDELRPFLNLRDEHDFTMIVGWLVGTYQVNGSYPINIFQGEQGSGKSSMSRLLGDLVDPSSPALSTMPRTERDLAISASKSHLLAYDNLSGINDAMSDSLCRVATGGGFVTRKLYSNDEETVFNYKRPVLLNGITGIVYRYDLADRSLFITTTPIPKDKRQTEGELKAKWDEARGRILGALLDAVSAALHNIGDTEVEGYPRMADFARWVVAAEEVLPWPKGRFVREYETNRMNIIDDALRSDPIASAILSYCDRKGNFSGTPTELMNALNQIVDDDTRKSALWPKQPNGLTRKLNRIATFLREKNIDIQSGKSGQRNITIKVVAGEGTEEVRISDIITGELEVMESVGIVDEKLGPPISEEVRERLFGGVKG